MSGYEMTALAVETITEFVAMVNHDHPNEDIVISHCILCGWEVREVPTGDGTIMLECFVTPRMSAMVWFEDDGGHAEW